VNAFEYAAPATVAEAVRLLASANATALAGGTDLLALLKDGVEAPARIVDLKGIPGLRGLAFDSAGLRIGALTTLRELLADARAAKEYPALAQAARGIASPQVAARGTVAGELTQRPRCWYYRGGHGLLAQADGASLVVRGDNRYHAILGNAGPAYFVHPSSLAPALIALRASATIAGPAGERSIPVEALYRIPQKAGETERTLAPGEIVTAIVVPPAGASASATYEVRQREALDWPLAAAAVALQVEGGTIRSARVVLGHVAPTPWRALDAEKALSGATAAPALATAAADAALRAAKPLSRNGYKVRLAKTAVKRAILQALGEEV
jgi:xanthine dehydrogenase YagS FAD-binding subunit